MSDFVVDRMTDTDWRDLALPSPSVGHVGEKGTPWTRHPSALGTRMYIFSNRVHCGVPGVVYAHGAPDSADYDVECDYTIFSGNVGNLGVAGRITTSGPLSCYHAFYNAGQVLLWKVVNGVATTVDWWDGVLSGGGAVHTLRLSMHGDAIQVYVNGDLLVDATDSSITAAGRAGLRATVANDAHTGKHVDNFRAYDTSVSPVGRSQVVGLIGI